MKNLSKQCKVFLLLLSLSVALFHPAIAQQNCAGSLLFNKTTNLSVNLPLSNYYYTATKGGYTWECWFKLNSAAGSTSNDRPLISSIDNVVFEDMYLGFGWHGGYKNRGYDSLVFKVDGPSSATPSDANCAWAPSGGFVVGKWYHVAGVADYGARKKYLYVNCTLVDSQPMTVAPNTRAIPTNLSACNGCTGANSIDGYMDEVRIWDKPLSAGAISANCNNCLTGSESDLFVYYRCNQAGALNVLDATANGNNGSLLAPSSTIWSTQNAPVSGAACTDACKCLGSLDFDTQNNPSVKLPLTNRYYYSPGNNGYTWECWFKLSSALSKSGSSARDRMLISAIDNVVYEDMYLGFGWHGGVNNKGYDSLVFKVDGPSGATPVDLNCAWAPAGGFNAGQWYHAAGVANYLAGKKYLYVNGSLVATQNLTVAPNTRTIQTNLSSCSACGTINSLHGKMDEVRLWDRPLTTTDIAANYQKCRVGNESNLLTYYRCNQVNASTVLDGSVNGWNGSFTNLPGWSGENAPVTGPCLYNCSKSSSSANTSKTTSMQTQVNAEDGVKIYPNPSSGSIKVSSGQPGVLRLYSITGKQLLNIEVQHSEQEIRLEGYSTGIYPYLFTSGSSTTSGKLIIE